MNKYAKSFLFSIISFIATPIMTSAHTQLAEDGAVILHNHSESAGAASQNAAAVLLGVSNDPDALMLALGLTFIALSIVYLLGQVWDGKRDTEHMSPEEIHRSHIRFLAGGTLLAIFVFILANMTAVVAFLTVALIIFTGWHAIHSRLNPSSLY